jgi:ABC-2 type transport system ATP-binding protein
VFFSSHILSEVTEVCDEVALINRGKLLFYDTIEGVTTKYAAEAPLVEVSFARPLEGNAVAAQIEAFEHVDSVEKLSPSVLRLRVTGGKEGQAAVFEAIGAMRVGATGFREAGSSLEQIYMQQIERGDQ